jgi:CHASE1-domain containing sensor protein
MGFPEKTVVAIVLAIILLLLIIFVVNAVYTASNYSLKLLFEDIITKVFSGLKDLFKK